MRSLCFATLLAACSAPPAPRARHPEADPDHDRIVAADRCPDEAEDEDRYADEDGCPDPDDDGDGVLDAADLCPCVAEDVDGWQDEDGCHDPDDDGDRIHDACDACPRDPETYNGCADDDGCPDHAHVVISESRIQILEHVRFARDSFDVDPRSLPLLDAIAQTMIANPQITRIRIVGHADSREARPDRLGQKRAEAVRDWLVAHGVDASRLDIASAGATRPIAPSTPIALGWQNRRVELEVLEIDGAAVDATAPPAIAPPRTPCSEGRWRSQCEQHPPREPIDVCAAAPAPAPLRE